MRHDGIEGSEIRGIVRCTGKLLGIPCPIGCILEKSGDANVTTMWTFAELHTTELDRSFVFVDFRLATSQTGNPLVAAQRWNGIGSVQSPLGTLARGWGSPPISWSSGASPVRFAERRAISPLDVQLCKCGEELLGRAQYLGRFLLETAKAAIGSSHFMCRITLSFHARTGDCLPRVR